MSVELFLTLMIGSVIITIPLTGALKKLLNASGTPYRANAVALDSAMIACTGLSVVYRIPFGLGFDPAQVFRLIALIYCTWILSMVTFDKLRQFKKQHRKVKELNKGGKSNDNKRAIGKAN